ncbi:histidinol-phosphate transaminase [Parabacteroides bouchesdurhonensis]|uniref:histidinol-phosphate transaminase n=1 Tax=Parabacteroides bouchesdurhonensis TaxID=1936995 RepID=UPI000E4686F7|nr:histidinol-phosphate transaminase [Parabacteroides bouchesdurhonensis]RHJ91709.1 histidinol-phosphate transaminase [Bacteroides sp. AM07-16]
MMSLEKLVRRNIRNMKPYSSARNEFHGTASVFLDANENPWNTTYNRYPDPLQMELKERVSELKGVETDSIFLGNGSDEAIDLVFRAFCDPGMDSVILIDPSYGMYEVCANLNNVECKKVLLNDKFDLDADKILALDNDWVKVVFLCSPNNPTGNCLNRDEIYKVLDKFHGIVIIDEAYVDFSSQPSFLTELNKFPNLIVLQTLSKAWGAAAIRLGMAFASPEIISVFNKIKYPYNVSKPSQEAALSILSDTEKMQKQLSQILFERSRIEKALTESPYFFKVYPSDANFLLVEVGNANNAYNYLVKKGIVVRNRNNITLCRGCLRITIGTPEENDILLDVMKSLPI